MDINMESIGIRIKKRRKEMQLTQTDIFKMCGIRSGALSRIENGTSVPSIILFYRIAQVLECDIQWLLTGDSSNLKTSIFSKNEENLLNGFRKLPEEDKEELMGILDVKLRKVQKVRGIKTKSSSLTDTGSDNMVS